MSGPDYNDDRDSDIDRDYELGEDEGYSSGEQENFDEDAALERLVEEEEDLDDA